MISIITPTYNREKTLMDCYNSLLNQNFKQFEWIVVDDGSVDNTQELIKKLQKENKVSIKYFYKKNGGKPSAYNLGIIKSSGNILLCLDSDDTLTNDALENIIDDFDTIKNNSNIAGLVYDNIKKTGELVGTSLPNNVIDSYYNIYKKYKVTGDKTQVIKKEVAQKYLFPQIDNEKFVPEALINNRISKKYKFKYKNKPIKVVEYLEDGYSNNYFSLVKKNPKGNTLYFKELYDFEKSIYNIYGYILFSIYSNYSLIHIINNHQNKILVILLFLPVYIISKIRK